MSGLVTRAGLEAVRQGLPGLRCLHVTRAAAFARVCGRCWWALVAFFGLATLASLRAIGQERMPLRGATLDRLGYAVVVLFHLILPVRPPPAVWASGRGLVRALLHVFTILPILPVADAAACSFGAPTHFLSLLTEWWLCAPPGHLPGVFLCNSSRGVNSPYVELHPNLKTSMC